MASSAARRFLQFVDSSPSPFHAVDLAKKMLVDGGYTLLHEGRGWRGQVERGGKYFFTRNASTIVAFSIGKKYEPGHGFRIIAAHTDSPTLKIKPLPVDGERDGYLQVGVQVYGGGLWYTWFDRDLKLAGRVIVREKREGGEGEEGERGGVLRQKLLHIERPILRIPSLAIHLNRDVNSEGMKVNAENDLLPIIATSLGAEGKRDSVSPFLQMVAKELNVTPSSIVDYDLVLADSQPAAIGGIHEEFIFSPRLDNLLSSFCALETLLTSSHLDQEDGVRMCMLFDNEEVGSVSFQGADSSLIDSIITRIATSFESGSVSQAEIPHISFRNSFLLSADMAHAVHPNFSAKHEHLHKPRINCGVVIKTNANMRYATTGATSAPLRELAARCNIPLQDFIVRNDIACGSTIGPILSSHSLRTADVGVPQLSMHSVREMCGVHDVDNAVKLFSAFYERFGEIEKEFDVDN